MGGIQALPEMLKALRSLRRAGPAHVPPLLTAAGVWRGQTCIKPVPQLPLKMLLLGGKKTCQKLLGLLCDAACLKMA